MPFDSRNLRLFAIVFALSALAVAQQAAKPKWEWKQAGSRTIELNTLEGQSFKLPRARLMKIAIDADSSTYSGILPVAAVTQYTQTKRVPNTSDFERVPCHQLNTVKGETLCRTDNIPYPGLFYVRDKRGTGTNALALYGAVKPMGGSQMVDRAAKPNRVTITIFLPQCVENCPDQK